MAEAEPSPARPTPGRNSSPASSRNKTGTHLNRIRPKHNPAASVKRQRRNIHPAVREQALAVHSVQASPAEKHPCSPVPAGAPAMSHHLEDRAKQRKNPHPPAALPDSTDRGAAVLPAANPAEAVALPEAGVAASPRTPRGATVLAADPATHPKALVSVAHSPKLLRKRKYPSPVQQESERLRQLESLGWELPALSLAQQESHPAVPSGLLSQNPGTAGMRPRPLPHPCQGRKTPARYSRNSAGPPEGTSLQ